MIPAWLAARHAAPQSARLATPRFLQAASQSAGFQVQTGRTESSARPSTRVLLIEHEAGLSGSQVRTQLRKRVPKHTLEPDATQVIGRCTAHEAGRSSRNTYAGVATPVLVSLELFQAVAQCHVFAFALRDVEDARSVIDDWW